MRYREILKEMLTSGEFTFGFELEAFIESEDLQNDGEGSEYFLNDMKDDILSIFTSSGFKGKVVNDSSLKPSNDNSVGFEFAAAPLNFSTSNITNIKKLLKSVLPKNNIYTNDSCGFHIHVSYPGISTEDMIWILAVLAFNPSWVEHISKFNDVDFFDIKYASTGFLDALKADITNKDFDEIKSYMDQSHSTKYRVIRMHPQGTLEWRGPRNFMNNYDSSGIDGFFVHLYHYIGILIKCQNASSVGGVSKKEFYSIFSAPREKPINIDKKYFGKGFKFEKFVSRFRENGVSKDDLINCINQNPWLLQVDFQNATLKKNGNKWDFTGTINGGDWNGGDSVIFKDGQFNNGVWESGTFDYGEWNGGTWKNGKWNFGFIDGDESDTPPNSNQ